MSRSIVAVGDNVVDCYPEHLVMFPGGNALNVSVFARRCGADASYLGAVGADDAGEQIRSELVREGVDSSRLRIEAGSTAYCVIGHRDGDRVFLSSDRGVSVFEPSAADLDFIAGHDAAHVGQSSGLDEALAAIAHRTRLSYDFATRRAEEHFRAIVPLCHLASFSAGDLPESDCRQLAQRAVGAGATWALVTRGMAGAILAHADGVHSCPAANGPVVDTLGAGDTFIARVLVGILRGDDPDSMLRDAALRAADTCARLGAFGAGRPISIRRNRYRFKEKTMTDGTYLGPGTVAPIPDDVVSSQEHALGLWPHIDNFISAIDRDITRVFLVGAGGSYQAMVPAQFVLDQHGTTPTVTMNSDEFFYRAPASVGPGSLVVVLSGTGNTRETIQAGTWASERGAVVAAVTLKSDGPLAQQLETAFVAQSGQGSQIVLQLIALAILKREGFDIESRLAALRALPGALRHAMATFEQRAAEVAADMKDVPVTNVLASGSLFGAASTFTMCYLQEMQWMHAATINADEFFQGPFEVIDKDTRAIVFLSEDVTRPMGERVRRFLDTYSGQTHYLDSRELDLPGIQDAERAYVAPLVFHALVARLAAHYAAVRGYALEGRRYMWKVDY